MMTPQNEQHVDAHPYFLDQKNGISDLHTIFGPHSDETVLNKGLSKPLEISLYCLFFSFIAVMVLLPTEPAHIQDLFPNTQLSDPVGFMLWLKMALFISSLVPLFWALNQSSKRMQGRLFHRKHARS